MEIKNLEKAGERILKAVKNKENIILYSDSDLDGTTSLIILKEALETLGGKIVSIYFPDREQEGYGLTETALNFLKNFSPALMIITDMGISSFKEVDLARKLGIETIIIDHHEILEKIPNADIIVDPKQPGDKSFKGLSAAGIVFKLVKFLLKNKMSESMEKNFLELVALSTIADMVPREDENEDFISRGVRYLENSWRPGIKSFLKYPGLFGIDTPIEAKINRIISILNIRDVENNLPSSYRVLVSPSDEQATKIIKILLMKEEIKRETIKKIEEEIETRIFNQDLPIIFEGDEDFEYQFIPSVASFFSDRYQKPVFIFKKKEQESVGTVRGPKQFNTVLLMQKCKNLLISFGGHPQASGFRIKNKNLEKFKACLTEAFKKIYGGL